MIGWLIALGIIAGLAILPVGGTLRYDASGLEAKLLIGPFKISWLPRRGKEKKSDKEKKSEEETKKEKEPARPENAKKPAPRDDLSTLPEEKGGSITDFLPLVEVALDALSGLRRRIRVNFLQLHLTMAGDDPCDLALNYGRANAAGAALMAQMERLFVIKKRDVGIACDFTSEETRILARLDLTITVGRLLSLVTVHGIRALKTFLKIKKQREQGGA